MNDSFIFPEIDTEMLQPVQLDDDLLVDDSPAINDHTDHTQVSSASGANRPARSMTLGTRALSLPSIVSIFVIYAVFSFYLSFFQCGSQLVVS